MNLLSTVAPAAPVRMVGPACPMKGIGPASREWPFRALHDEGHVLRTGDG